MLDVFAEILIIVFKLQFLGLIDFNELTSSKYIFEVSTFQMYMMISAQKRGYDVDQAESCALAGFEEVLQLNEDEKRCLHICMTVRLIISLTTSALAMHENNLHKTTQINLFYEGSCSILKRLYRIKLKSQFDLDTHSEC